MTGTVQDRDSEVGDAAVAREGDPAEVIGNAVVKVERAARRGPDDRLLHVSDRR